MNWNRESDDEVARVVRAGKLIEKALAEVAGGGKRKITLTEAQQTIAAQGGETTERPDPWRQGVKSPKPTFGEPEGKKPGARPSAGEPDDPTSPSGFPQSRPIDVGPGHRRVPPSLGDVPPEPVNRQQPLVLLRSWATANAGRLGVPIPADLFGMIDREAKQ